MSDLISRQAAIDALGEEPPVWYDGEGEIAERNQWRRDVTAIKELPSAQPQRIRGRWIEKPHVHGVAYCSLCEYELHTNDTNFCPNCGAKMEVGEDAD